MHKRSQKRNRARFDFCYFNFFTRFDYKSFSSVCRKTIRLISRAICSKGLPSSKKWGRGLMAMSGKSKKSQRNVSLRLKKYSMPSSMQLMLSVLTARYKSWNSWSIRTSSSCMKLWGRIITRMSMCYLSIWRRICITSFLREFWRMFTFDSSSTS